MELVVLVVVVAFVFTRLSRRNGRSGVAVETGPVGWVAGIDWRVVRPLARADLRRVLRHPAFVVGVLLTPLMLLPATEFASSWRDASGGIALALVPLGWSTIIATNLVALRPRRTGAEELFATLPAPQPVRTSALLATAVGPVAVASVLAGGWVGVLGRGFPDRGGELRGSPQWAELGVGVLIVAGSVCVGVAVARWLHHGGFGVLAAIATLVLQVRFLDVTTWPWSRPAGDPLRFLGFIAEDANTRADFLEVRPAGWHLLYVGGLVVAMAGIALARDGLRRPTVVVLGIGLLVAAGAGWMQTRPISEAVEDEMVAQLRDPARYQRCEDAGRVRYCAYEEFLDDVPSWQAVVGATTSLVPAGLDHRPPLAVTQRPPRITGDPDCAPMRFEETLPPSVADRLSPEVLWPADDDVHPPFSEESFPCSDEDVHGFFLAVQTGAWAVGLPPAPHHDDVRCTATGQARAPIALWAGAAASRDGAATLREVVVAGADGTGHLTFDGWDGPPTWGVTYAVDDAQLALAMLALDPADVGDRLAPRWAHWTDPATGTAALARSLGIPGGSTPTRSSGSCP